MIEDEIERLWFAVTQRLKRESLRFGFKTAASERALDSAIRVEDSLRSQLLRARTFDGRNDAQCHGFAASRGFSQCVEDDALHDVCSLERRCQVVEL